MGLLFIDILMQILWQSKNYICNTHNYPLTSLTRLSNLYMPIFLQVGYTPEGRIYVLKFVMPSVFLISGDDPGVGGMDHEPQGIERKIVCLNVNFYGVAWVMFSKGSKPLKKSLAAGMEEHVVRDWRA